MDATSTLRACQEVLKEIAEVGYDTTEPFHEHRKWARFRRARACFFKLLDFAEPGSPEIWFALGLGHQKGHGLVRDDWAATRWLRRAAEAGHVPAMVPLSRLLLNPKPGPDPEGGIHWLRAAAAQGEARAMISLGFCHREGHGVPVDEEAALDWFRRAAEAGARPGLLHAGRMLVRHLERPAEALGYFLRAAEGADEQSYTEIAEIYDDPSLGLYDPAEAFRWYRKAADHYEGTNARSMLALGRMHLEGRGASCDAAQARFWLGKVQACCHPASDFHRQATKLLSRLDGALL